MQIDKAQVLELIRSQKGGDQAQAAEGELPDKVDTDAHADLLSKFGISPGDLIAKFGGNLPGGLGGLLS